MARGGTLPQEEFQDLEAERVGRRDRAEKFYHRGRRELLTRHTAVDEDTVERRVTAQALRRHAREL